MIKAVLFIQPFELEQNIYVYENGNKIDVKKINLDNTVDNVINLIDQYDISVLELAGPKQFNKGIAKKIKEAELSKYNANKIQINYL